MAKGKMTSPHPPCQYVHRIQLPDTKECSALLVLFTSRSAHLNTKVAEAPDLSFKQLLHFTEHTLLLPSQGHVREQEEAKGNKSQSTSSVNKIQFLSQRLQDCRQFKTRTGEFVNREEEEFQASQGLG